MNYKGVIIEESLQDKSILQNIKILDTKIEQVTEQHKTPWVKQWTLHTIEISETEVDSIAKLLSHSIDTSHKTSWYIDYNNNIFHFVIFPDKIFKIKLGDSRMYEEARRYGISLGIPKYQLQLESLVKR